MLNQEFQFPIDRYLWKDMQKTSEKFILENSLQINISSLNWEEIEHKYKPCFTYDPEIYGIMNKESEINEYYSKKCDEEGRYKCSVLRSSTDEPIKLEEPKSLIAKLMIIRASLNGKKMGNKFLDLAEKPKVVFTDFEKKIMQWEPGYAGLQDEKYVQDGFFIMTKGINIGKPYYEIESEYLFGHQDSHVILSVSKEINTNRPIFGLRRSLSLDWPPHENSKILGNSRLYNTFSLKDTVVHLHQSIEDLKNI